MADFAYVPDYSYEENVGYRTLVTEYENGVEQRRSARANPRRAFTLVFGKRDQTEKDGIETFFKAKYGSLTSFTWENPADSTEYTVRFVEDSLRIAEVGYQVYDISLGLVEVL